MKTGKKTAVKRHPVMLPTAFMAAQLGVKPETPRTSYCRFGHWMGLSPVKLPNGRLLWDAEEVERLLSGGVL